MLPFSADTKEHSLVFVTCYFSKCTLSPKGPLGVAGGQGEWASVLPDALPGEREWEERWSQVCHKTPRGLRGGLAPIQLGIQRGFRKKVEDGARP